MDDAGQFRCRDAGATEPLSREVDAAEAQLHTAHDLVSFTELKADAPGTITATGPGAGKSFRRDK